MRHLLWLALFLGNSLSASCLLENLKVAEFKTRGEEKIAVLLSTEQEVWINHSSLPYRYQFGPTSERFDLTIDGLDCQSIKSMEKVSIDPDYITSFHKSNGHACIECLTFAKAPLLFQVPPYSEMKQILHENSLSDDSIRLIINELISVFQELSHKTKTANSTLFSVLLLKRLADHGVDRLTGEFLFSLAELLKGRLKPHDIATFKNAVRQIDYVDLQKVSGQTAMLTYYGKSGRDMVMDKKSVVVAEADKAAVQKYFDNFMMRNGATITIKELSKNKRLPSFDVVIDGLLGTGVFPIIGKMQVDIKKIDIQKEQTPVVVGIKVNKGFIGINHSLKVDY